MHRLIARQHEIVQQLREEDEVDPNRFASLRWAQGRLSGLRSAYQALSPSEDQEFSSRV